jgi:O-antigen/teichoic acid export membrane protein
MAVFVGNFLLMAALEYARIGGRRMVMEFGQTEDAAALRPYVVEPSVTMTRAVVVGAAAAFVAVPWIVALVLPDYRAASGLIRLVLLAAAFMAAGTLMDGFLYATRRQPTRITLLGAALVMNVAVGYALIARGHGVQGAAWGAVVSWAFFLVATLGLVARVFFPIGRMRAAWAGRMLLPLILLGAGVVAANMISEPGSLSGVLGVAGAGLLVCGPTAALLVRGMGRAR